MFRLAKCLFVPVCEVVGFVTPPERLVWIRFRRVVKHRRNDDLPLGAPGCTAQFLPMIPEVQTRDIILSVYHVMQYREIHYTLSYKTDF